MTAVKIYELLQKRVVVTRGSARAIESDLVAALIEGQGEIVLDFVGVEGLTPSFFDEVLSIIEESFDETFDNETCVTIANPPTNLSSKFSAVGRGHDLIINEANNGTWIISRKEET